MEADLEMDFTPMLSINYDFYWRKLDHLDYQLNDIKHLHLLVRLGELFRMLEKIVTISL